MQMKRSSLVSRHPQADRVEYLEGNSKQSPWRRLLETAAGSKSTARSETEASGTWEIHRRLGRAVGRSSRPTERTNLREVDATVEVGPARNTRSAGKPRTGGRGGAE
jgi:hypothetical protein